jgi:ribosomal protein S18 acetylase RimI-like enzyme
MTDAPPSIRHAVPSDAPTLVAFNRAMAMETEDLALDPQIVFKGVGAVLADPSKGIYFLAELDDHPAGCLLITHEWSDWRNGDIWWIQSVYVHPDFRRRGVFKALYRHVEQAARAAGAVGVRLYVEQENTPAQATYLSLGMELSHYRLMQVLFGALRR